MKSMNYIQFVHWYDGAAILCTSYRYGSVCTTQMAKCKKNNMRTLNAKYAHAVLPLHLTTNNSVFVSK